MFIWGKFGSALICSNVARLPRSIATVLRNDSLAQAAQWS